MTTAGVLANTAAGIATQVLTGISAGAVTAASGHLISNKGRLKGIEKSILYGAAAGGIAAGVAHGVMESQFMTSLVGDGTTLASSVNNVIKSVGMAGADSLINGRDFADSFLASILQTTANGYVHEYMSDFTVLSQSFVSGVVGGMITSEIYGGDFASNFAHGFIGSYIDYTHNELGGMLDFDFSLVEAIELTMDFVPVVSNLKAAYEFSTGETIFGGVELSDLDRNLAGATILLGPVGKAAVKTGKAAYTVAKHSDDAVDMLTASSKVHDATRATDAALSIRNSSDKGQLWTNTKKKTGVENALGHWKKHGAEFPELQNAKKYVEATNNFLNHPPTGTLTKTRSNGDVVRYNEQSNTFGVMTKEGTPRTMFKPDPKQHGFETNLEYFNDQ
ncbi:pre-toxin TG domain-containing protein [Vibrio hepatarius]|uniref:pre-toxin TG domain-containing protein n=1 Tax=Vibrio hepatarius TaxID=171383 RepID=UPI001C08576C|nr:pre-toxin TG domain-containing protein [Vibrio hepatarius]MBU2895225.1 hypothetical protein [Vibrio hepatarius]